MVGELKRESVEKEEREEDGTQRRRRRPDRKCRGNGKNKGDTICQAKKKKIRIITARAGGGGSLSRTVISLLPPLLEIARVVEK
jgi:hypothetical protein